MSCLAACPPPPSPRSLELWKAARGAWQPFFSADSLAGALGVHAGVGTCTLAARRN